MYSNELIQYIDILNELKRSIGVNNSKTEGMNNTYSDILKLMTKYAFCTCCFDSNSLDEGYEDVKYDGYDSYVNKIFFNY